MNRLNSSDVNCGPLSETSCSGIPYEAKHDRRHSIVFVEIVEVIGKTSIHFECESISTRNICLFSLRNRCGHVAKHVLAISKDASVLRAEDCALTDMFRNLLSFLLCQHPALATRDSILPNLSSGQCRDVPREVHSRDVHVSMEESPHVYPITGNLGLHTIQICACSKASVYHLSRGLAIHSVCIRSTFIGQDPS